MPIRTRRSLLTYKLETAYGTLPTGDYRALEIVRDPSIAPLVADELERATVRPWPGADRVRLINPRVTIGFDIQLSGSGVAGTPPQYGDFLTACANTETIVPSTSVTYTLASLSGSIPSVTFRWYADGTRHQVLGARGTWTLTLNTGAFPILRIEATGLYSQPTDSALITASYANQAVPFEVSATNTPTMLINSAACCMNTFELNIGNTVEYESRAGCVAAVNINDRVPSGSIQIESKYLTGETGQNFYALAEAGTLVPISWIHNGGGAGNTAALSMANCQLKQPTLDDVSGKQFMTLPFSPISTDGTSEISLAFT